MTAGKGLETTPAERAVDHQVGDKNSHRYNENEHTKSSNGLRNHLDGDSRSGSGSYCPNEFSASNARAILMRAPVQVGFPC